MKVALVAALLAVPVPVVYAPCPPTPMLKVIHQAKRARMIRLGARSDRSQDPLDRGDRFLGFEALRVVEIEAPRIPPLVRAFENTRCYACGDRGPADQLTVAPVQIGFEFESDGGRVGLVLFQPEQQVQMEFSNGAFAEAPFSERGADLWLEALKKVLAPGQGPTDFYDAMRAPGRAPRKSATAPRTPSVAADTAADDSCAHASEQDLQPVTKVAPEYPDLARQTGVDGEVRLRVLVGPDGRVVTTQIVKSIPMLDDAAVAAVLRWRFAPATRNGVPVCAWTAVPVRFTLH
jgi:TonB family protein